MNSTPFAGIFSNRRVLITGHTGFKGSWLSHWLLKLGARVHGYALDPQPDQQLFGLLGLDERLDADCRADVRNLDSLLKVVDEIRPEFIFHLAAQPIVRLSFEQPSETFAVNVMGTVHLLESVRLLKHPCTVVVVTTDKCYENREWLSAYREDDPMGGHDPYSASKGCAELLTASYRKSFFASDHHQRIATARAGNVIGGGDWAKDRIVPDVFRAIQNGKPVPVRNKAATRPWQHVLEPLSGYLWLAANLSLPIPKTQASSEQLAASFNFGPPLESNRTVLDVVESILAITGGHWLDECDPNAPHEASKLNLAIEKAFHLLQWQPTWSFQDTIFRTVEWYSGVAQSNDPVAITNLQIEAYEKAALEKHIGWINFESI
jgi:CDP-glucose 4,6-dehydratase